MPDFYIPRSKKEIIKFLKKGYPNSLKRFDLMEKRKLIGEFCKMRRNMADPRFDALKSIDGNTLLYEDYYPPKETKREETEDGEE